MCNLDHPILVGAKNTNSWCARKGDLQRDFPLDVPMVLSSVITVATDGERQMCGGLSLGETVHLGNFKFIADYFGGLSLSPMKDDIGAAFMRSTHSGTPSSRWAMIEDTVEEFLMVSSRKGGFGLPSPRRHGTGALRAPVATTPWLKDITIAQQAESYL
jgi:hypothetical protein